MKLPYFGTFHPVLQIFTVIIERMNKQNYYKIVSVIFGVIAVLHLARALYGLEAVIADVVIPVWVSWVGVLIAGYLSVRGWQFAKK